MNIEQLNTDFGIEGQLKFVRGHGDLPFIEIKNNSATALISIYAAQVLSFQPIDATEDLLFLSEQSCYEVGKAIRGGIPICWPWFGSDPQDVEGLSHGFVRNDYWTVIDVSALSPFETKVTLNFTPSNLSDTTWPYDYALELQISIGSELRLELLTRNLGDQAFTITQAFHSYFKVGNIEQVQILGLEGAEYLDKCDEDTQKYQTELLMINAEVDRIYNGLEKTLIIDDTALKRRIEIRSSSHKSTVAWNPWLIRSEEFEDLAADSYQTFMCLETGNVGSNDIELLPYSEYRFSSQFKILDYQFKAG
jgi:glucose-6-phosphate 1-epimerase